MGKFQNIIFDFDSTLVSVEGLDEIAKNRGLEKEVERITNSGMSGNLPFSKSLRLRWNLIKPQQGDIAFLVQKYQHSLLPEINELLEKLKDKKVYIVTGGVKEAIHPVTRQLGVPDENVFAVCTRVDNEGNLILDERCLMTRDEGKTIVVDLIKKTGKTVVIGDGMTDFIAGKHADAFIGFGGHVKREAVQSVSEIYIEEPSLLKVLEYI